MLNNQEDMIWQRLSKALFGGRRTTDEGLFIYRIMEQVRAMNPVMEDLAWHRFLRWAVPMLGAGVAGLFLAGRAPSTSLLMDKALFHQQSTDTGSLSAALQED